VSRFFTLVYGLIAYAAFLAAFTYAVGFVGGIIVPRSVDAGGPSAPLAEAILVNVALLGLFGIQHSVMARQWFKRWWTTIVPRQVERSTFVLLTSLILGLIFWQWRPIPATVWSVEEPAVSLAFWSLFGFGWLVVLLSTFIIDHFDLFGLRQTVLYALGKPYTSPVFKVSAFYRHVRHPLLLGFIISFYATPYMTAGHLLFALVTTAYILVAIQLEERDLAAVHGDDYREYQQRVSMLIPFLPRRKEVPGIARPRPAAAEATARGRVAV
jgi:protein-S-isoprenylcysteine O-methyltransferase Ste14